jgi:hypothetical protein
VGDIDDVERREQLERLPGNRAGEAELPGYFHLRGRVAVPELTVDDSLHQAGRDLNRKCLNLDSRCHLMSANHVSSLSDK